MDWTQLPVWVPCIVSPACALVAGFLWGRASVWRAVAKHAEGASVLFIGKDPVRLIDEYDFQNQIRAAGENRKVCVRLATDDAPSQQQCVWLESSGKRLCLGRWPKDAGGPAAELARGLAEALGAETEGVPDRPA